MHDVAIVGAGVAGLSAAVEAVDRGLRPLLIDAGVAGAATPAGAGIISPGNRWDEDSPLMPFVYAAMRHHDQLVRRLLERNKAGSWFARSGALHVALDHEEELALGALLAQLETRSESGLPYVGSARHVSRSELRALHPYVANNYGGILIPEASRLDGHGFAAALKKLLSESGVEVHRADIDLAAPESSIRRQLGVSIDAKNVIFATGACPLPGPTMLFPQRGQLLNVQVDHNDGQLPSLMGFGSHYVVSMGNGAFLLGPTREDEEGDPRPSLKGLAEITTKPLHLAPGLARAVPSGVRVGIRPMSLDGMPIVGRLTESGPVFVTGLDGFGLQLGPFAGALGLRLITASLESSFASVISPRRFHFSDGAG